jgi:peptidoglycan/xylan/chitin deacetylase (PgdA/CDA1 family)
MRTRVCITIDTEFSIAGAFSDRAKVPVSEQLVWCNVEGRSEGLGFMLDTFKKYKVEATFFVETLHRRYFANDPMGPIAQAIHDAGHEVQLHTHPCWSLFEHSDWWDRAHTQRRPDDFAGLPVEESLRHIEQGIDTFRHWGLPRPLAFRSGNLQHDDNLYLALAQAGIPYASNVAVGIRDSGHPGYRLYSGQHERHGVTECPVLTYADWSLGAKQHLKSLTILGASFGETRDLLEKARLAGIPLVVILTHPFEYVQNRDLAFSQVRRHSLAQQRLTRLCEFLDENSDRFEACGMVRAAKAGEADNAANTLLDGTLTQTVRRMAAQVAYDKFGKFALNRQFGGAG